MKAVNLKEKLANARKTCMGYSEYAYRFVDYVAENLTGPVGPIGLGAAVTLRFTEIQNCYGKDGHKLPEYYIAHREEILEEAWVILQVIDVVTNDEFAEEFREFCGHAFGWKVLKRLTVTDDEDYPESVKAALDWWTGVIQAGRNDERVIFDRDYRRYKQLTAEEILTFRKSLAEELRHGWLEFLDTIDGEIRDALSTVDLSSQAEGNAVPMPHRSFFNDEGMAWMDIKENYVMLGQDGEDKPVVVWWKDE